MNTSVLNGIMDVKAGASNRHPVDALADVRARIKALQEREAELRGQVLELAAAIGGTIEGDEWTAAVSETQTTRLDAGLCKAELGSELYDRLCKTSTTTTVRLKAKCVA